MEYTTWTAVRESYFAFHERIMLAAGGAAPQGPPPPPSSYLEQFGNSVTGEQGKQEKEERGKQEEGKGECIEVRACGCRSRFCPECCLPLGIRLKERLRPELGKFKGLMMLTFTIDPQLFESPGEAYQYVTRKRCIAVTIQRLHRWGFLHSRRWLSVVEWQKDTQQAHWHVLVDASRIPFEKLCEAWNRNWKGWRERVKLGRPGFGSVRFTVGQFKDVKKAVGYVTAYLTKHPAHGYPEWVLGMKVRKVHRFSVSRGFWTEQGGQDVDSDEHDEPAEDQHEAAVEEQEQEQAGQDEVERGRTVAEQIATCRTSCIVCQVREAMDDATGEVVERREFIMRLPIPLSAVLALQPDGVNKRETAAWFKPGRPVLRELREHQENLAQAC